MELKVLGSSSVGNCYLLVGQESTLIIEAGVRFHLVKKALNFDLTKVVGVLVSHSHG
jgi:phosphoribosyl 1,2-cyclic phosphodiesterase